MSKMRPGFLVSTRVETYAYGLENPQVHSVSSDDIRPVLQMINCTPEGLARGRRCRGAMKAFPCGRSNVPHNASQGGRGCERVRIALRICFALGGDIRLDPPFTLLPRIEPREPARQAGLLTTILQRHPRVRNIKRTTRSEHGWEFRK